MSELSRDLIKFVRDKAKSRYNKEKTCFICNSSDNLDFHHYYSLTPLLNKWLQTNKLAPKTDEEIKNIRDEFIEQHTPELYDYAVTLCHAHHLRLHSLYGKNPSLTTAEKQIRWVQIQRDKHAR